MDQATQERSGGHHHGTRADRTSVGGRYASDSIFLYDQIGGFTGDYSETNDRGEFSLHRLPVQLPVRLGARPANSRSFTTIEQPELYPGPIGNTPHKAVERIDFTNQMALADAADGRIARHFTDFRRILGDQRYTSAKPRRCRCGLAAGMSATDHHYVVCH